MVYDGWGEALEERFPPRDPVAERGDWNALRQRLSVGQPVRGVVVAQAAFGAWLDIGAGFPALLLLPDVAGITPERYAAGEWCPVGSTLDVQVVLFNDPDRKIRVAQGVPHEDRARAGVTPDRPAS
jgi:ribosomal protein S1